MSKYDPNAFGSLSLHSRLASLFRSQTELLDELLEKPLPETCQHITPLLGAIRGNCRAMLLLERDGFLNELALIQRIFVQRIINCCYLVIAEKQVIESYLSQTTAVAKDSPRNTSGDALVEFSKNYTPEQVASPFSLSLRAQAEEISQKVDVPKELLLVSIAGVFPKSSEILAGSLYGTAFQFGVFKPKTHEPGESFLKTSEQLSTDLFMGVCLLGVLFKCVSKRESIESIREKSSENFKLARELVQGARNNSLRKFTTVDGTWERLDSMESNAGTAISKQLQRFALPFQEAYEAGVIAPLLKPASQTGVDLKCAALLLKRSLNDFRGVWLLLCKGYTSQAASVAASLYESALATICLTQNNQNVEKYKTDPNGEIPWSPKEMAKMVARGMVEKKPNPAEEFESLWPALYAHYVWLCQIKHSAHASVLHDTSASTLDGKGYVVMAIPNVETEDADVKASIAIKSLMRLLECIEAFARALGYADKLPEESRFAERVEYANKAGWEAFLPFAKPSPISISRSQFVKKYSASKKSV